MKNAAERNLVEMKLGKMAEQEGSSVTVKGFAKRTVDDHSKLNADLQHLAAPKSFTLPSSENAGEKASDKPLDWRNGPDFDKAYISDMVKDHERAAALFQAEIQNGNDADEGIGGPTASHYSRPAPARPTGSSGDWRLRTLTKHLAHGLFV